MTVTSLRTKSCSSALLAFDELPDGLALEWDDLSSHASEPNSFYERWFVEASVRHLHTPEDFKLLTVRAKGGELIGLMPVRSGQTYGRTPILTIENWLHYNQFLGVPLVRAGHEGEFWNAALDALDRDWPGPDIFYFAEFPAQSEVTRALLTMAGALKRRSAVVHRYNRALLTSGETPDDYWAGSVRKKKRKELARLENRLAELGDVITQTLRTADGAQEWIDQFLQLEASGWKASEGAALAKQEQTRAFFTEAMTNGLASHRVEILRMTVGSQVIAMLVNLLTSSGSFSFKIAYDEAFARFSPGILIEKANLQRLNDPAFVWMDSCAVEDHPMINSLWRGRREIIRIAMPRMGTRPGFLFAAVRFAETGWSKLKDLRKPARHENRTTEHDDQF